jgi:hypothetical protein
MPALDAHHGVRGVRMLSRGGLSATVVEQTDVLRAALKMAATTFVLCHNRPSGDPKTTDDDVFLTNAVEHAVHLIGTASPSPITSSSRPPGASPLCSAAEAGPVLPPNCATPTRFGHRRPCGHLLTDVKTIASRYLMSTAALGHGSPRTLGACSRSGIARLASPRPG